MMSSLICTSHTLKDTEHLMPRIETPTQVKKQMSHVLFNLMVANDGQLPVKTFVELEHHIFWGLKVPNVGFLILEEPHRVLERKISYKTSRHHRLEFNMACISSFCGKIWGRNI